MKNSTFKGYLRPALLIVSLILIFTISRNTFDLAKRGDSIEEAKKRVEELKQEQARLLSLREKVESEEFVEREAREKLGLAKPGEVVVVLPPEETLRRLAPKIEENDSPEKLPIWKRWVRMFF